MLIHYLKVAIRNIVRFRTYSAINLIGLVIGFTCFLLIALYILHELSYDKYHLKGERIYRLALGSIKDNRMGTCISAGAMPLSLKASFAGIEEVVRVRHLPSTVAYQDQMVFEEKFFFTDVTFFSVFTHPLIVGDPKSALEKPFSMVLTENTALRYFGQADDRIIGKLLQVDESMTFIVTGIVENPPDNSHFKFDMLASAASLVSHPQEHVRTYQLESWYSHYFHNYILLEQGADAKLVDENIRNAAKKYSDPVYYERFGTNMGLFLQPLHDIHFQPLRGELEEQGDSIVLSILGVVGLVVMVLGCVNYMNISTAQSIHRISEVGVRKAMGASGTQMATQFLGESGAINLLALFLAIGVADLALPYFNVFTGKVISLSILNVSTATTLVGIALLAGVLGGLYPTAFLTRYSPVKSLKKISVEAPGRFSVRRLIVIFQFAVSILLVGGTFLIFSQVKHMLGKDLGLSTEQVIVIPTHGDPLVNSKADAFFERLSNRSEVASYTISELSPGDPIYGIVASFEGSEIRNYSTTGVDHGFLDTYKINLLAGRNFSLDQPLDTLEKVIVNESLIKLFNWTPEQAIGKRYDMGGDGETVGQIIGVVQDFNFNSLREEVQPVVMGIMPYFYQKIAVRLTGDLQSSVDIVREAWENVYPTRPFEFRFADQSIEQLYQKERKFGKLFMLFALVASSIGLLGLFGITSLELKFRTKEIGIRKVLGAPIRHLLLMLSRDFFKLTSIAFILSIPLAWYLMNEWLQNFTYRIQSIYHYILWPGLMVMILAAVVVFVRTWSATTVNPIDTLRSE